MQILGDGIADGMFRGTFHAKRQLDRAVILQDFRLLVPLAKPRSQ
jgi:hypothetical protein